MQANKRLRVATAIIFVLIPILLFLGVTLLDDRKYYIVSIGVVVLASLPFFISFERKKLQPREILIIAVMAAISVAGRCLFFFIPGFKPVAAITSIAGFALGAEAGFLTGALSALVSNIFFGQGPWTPFQMFAWGMIGFMAGLASSEKYYTKKWFLVLFGALSGVFFSLTMDVWGAMSTNGVFTVEAYVLAIGTAIPFTVMYAVSNIIFLLFLTKPFIEKLNRVKKKFGLFKQHTVTPMKE